MLRNLLGANLLALSAVITFADTPDSVRYAHFSELYGIEVSEDRSSSDYYAEVEGLSGRELFSGLHELTGKNFRGFGYGEARDILYNKADNVNGKVYTHYSDLYVNGRGRDWKEDRDANGDGTSSDFVNCEHIWPQSKFGKALPMVADIHHLFSTFSKPNGMRSNLPFGEIKRSVYQTSAGSKLGDNQEFEPADTAKGNVARAMMYFYVRYHDRNIYQQGTSKEHFFLNRLPMFLKWHQQDPVDENEKKRNDVIYSHQRNRNPFIDRPEFAERIGVDGFDR